MKKSLFLLTLMLMIVVGCSKDDDAKLSLSTNSIFLYAEDTEKITANEKVTWSSDDEFVATIDNSGTVTGEHVGKTIITATGDNGESKCTVEVKAKYNTYTEPVLEFGSSKSTIKSKEKRTLLNEDATSLSYKSDKSPVQVVIYLFENGKMKSVGVFVNLSSSRETTNFLLERYMPVSTGSGNIAGIMLNNLPDLATMSVTIGVESEYALVAYMPYSRTKTRSISEDDITMNKLKELFESSGDSLSN